MVSSARRVRLTIFSVLAFGILLLFRSSISLPEYLKDIDYDIFSRVTSAGSSVDEIYGLLHVVTTDKAVLNGDFDWEKTQKNLSPYSGSRQVDWDAEKERIDGQFPVIIFSKTYCPFSARARDILSKYELSPPLKVIEVNERPDSDSIKTILTRLTDLSTVPNTIVRGKSLGDSATIVTLHNRGELREKLLQA